MNFFPQPEDGHKGGGWTIHPEFLDHLRGQLDKYTESKGLDKIDIQLRELECILDVADNYLNYATDELADDFAFLAHVGGLFRALVTTDPAFDEAPPEVRKSLDNVLARLKPVLERFGPSILEEDLE